MTWSLPELPWLPAAEEFRERCRAVDPASSGADSELRRLANHTLDINQLSQLARLLGRCEAAGNALKTLGTVRLALLGNGTLSLLAPAIRATGLRHGLRVEVLEAPFGAVAQEALDAQSTVSQWKPDLALLAIDHRALPLIESIDNPGQSENGVVDSLSLIQTLRTNLRENAGAASIVQTVPSVPAALFGSFDAALPGTLGRAIDGFNRELADSIGASGDLLFDVASLAATVGLDRWHDSANWNHGKLPFDPHLTPLYADHLCRLLAAYRGKSRKVLVLDLDNTLWGGVIGDDGLEGIALGNGSALGEAFLSVQQMALRLRQRGIVLAVSSKNDEARALEPFRSHPEMLLHENHIACFQANWEDKATNIRAIAEELSLGLDSFVFLDDNPAERALVRRFLPQVAVPELPADPSQYASTIWAAGYFEAIAYSSEDGKRADDYQANASRRKLEGAAGDLDGYLRSLKMKIHFAPFDDPGRARISQLINKSNQFNLTTRRYSEVDVSDMQRQAGIFTLQVRLADMFGDNGMICVIVCRAEGSIWEIDTWLMSCRVLKRRVEEAVLQEIVTQARQAGIKTVVGRYIPTERNGMVREHYKTLGFDLVEQSDGGESVWRLDVASTADKSLPMQVIREGFTPVILDSAAAE
ncbi:MAG: HAD family hydrolase [Reyranella sp.]|uniref:HAD-IIIC family phosphatase n=1 Tax=Reyranella sp. TaxID=1929291 RepID=UPI001AC096B6|nr:HAD-IIIC family phosphatase [Reyranella sp.]MBN9088878.1 HAD family hydrolase [Reyranella sp.]